MKIKSLKDIEDLVNELCESSSTDIVRFQITLGSQVWDKVIKDLNKQMSATTTSVKAEIKGNITLNVGPATVTLKKESDVYIELYHDDRMISQISYVGKLISFKASDLEDFLITKLKKSGHTQKLVKAAEALMTDAKDRGDCFDETQREAPMFSEYKKLDDALKPFRS